MQIKRFLLFPQWLAVLVQLINYFHIAASTVG